MSRQRVEGRRYLYAMADMDARYRRPALRKTQPPPGPSASENEHDRQRQPSDRPVAGAWDCGLAASRETSPPVHRRRGVWAGRRAQPRVCISRRTGKGGAPGVARVQRSARDSLGRPSRPGGPEHRTANTDSARIEARRLPPNGGYGAPGVWEVGRLTGLVGLGPVCGERSVQYSVQLSGYRIPSRPARGGTSRRGAWRLGETTLFFRASRSRRLAARTEQGDPGISAIWGTVR